ncbi:hypothetical protein CYLTODRAFT_15633, partial [Cylindrobasidium torrendii FP15055 ss-10]
MPRTHLPLEPRVPFAAVAPRRPFTRAWLRSFHRRYSALPAELKEEIAIWAILIIRDALKKDIKKRALSVKLPDALYGFACAINLKVFRRLVLPRVFISRTDLFRSFGRSVRKIEGVATSVVTLSLNGTGMGRQLDWQRLRRARPHMRNLISMGFVDFFMDYDNYPSLFEGLEYV